VNASLGASIFREEQVFASAIQEEFAQLIRLTAEKSLLCRLTGIGIFV
jgi:hypothetical protein